MRINADSLVELDEAIDAHKADGWILVDRVRTPDGNYYATLRRRSDEIEKETKTK